MYAGAVMAEQLYWEYKEEDHRYTFHELLMELEYHGLQLHDTGYLIN